MRQARVELDIFSGRPNPTWELSREEARTFADMVSALPTADRATVKPDGLGYRGFLVEVYLRDVGTTQVRVYRGAVAYGPPARPVRRADPERRLEKWLLASGKPTLSNETYNTLANEVNQDEKEE